MTETTPDLAQMSAAASAAVAGCASLSDLEQLKVELFGKKGAITGQLKSLGALPPDQRREAGARINAVRDELGALIEARRAELEQAELARRLAADHIDVTQPGRGQQPGNLHPVTRVRRRIEYLFRAAGFSVEDDPSAVTLLAFVRSLHGMLAAGVVFGLAQGLLTRR